ncbi:polycystic kidney disease protein 1-like 2 [Nematolebias whitei]|uniref:polycystic kidney disease protein 1-like 2 n=1 Tax=Nematolebias whitei TaxID=451745 RepID=UPI00189A9197|nr:polycystic kidney disease protein 1-like 2 [Nematolebias whitei]
MSPLRGPCLPVEKHEKSPIELHMDHRPRASARSPMWAGYQLSRFIDGSGSLILLWFWSDSVCILEKISGLRATILKERDDCSGSPCITLGVLFDRGEPVQLHFTLTGDDGSFYETRKMNRRREIFHIRHPLQASCGDCKNIQPNSVYTIQSQCLPNPFNFDKYDVTVKVAELDQGTQSICVTLTPPLDTDNNVRLTCTDGCDQPNQNKDPNIVLNCNDCSNIVWYIEDIRDEDHWDKNTKDCYKEAQKIPLTEKEDHKSSYKVKKQDISNAKTPNVTVVVIYTRQNVLYYKTYKIKTSYSGTPDRTTKPPHVASSAPHSTTKPPQVDTTKDDSDPSGGTTKTPSSNTGATTSHAVTSATTRADTTTSKLTTRKSEDLTCTISPNSGTALDAFKISCSTKSPCFHCWYCFRAKGKRLLCSKDSEVKAVYLPRGDSSSNYNLLITATAKNVHNSFSTTLTAQVMDFTTNSVDALSTAVANIVDQLRKEGLLSGELVGEIVNNVAQKLNDQSDESSKEDKQKLREQILRTLIDTINEFPTSTPTETQVVASGLSSLIMQGDELSLDAQISASNLFANLSLSIVHMNVSSADDKEEIVIAASTIVKGVSDILEYSSNKEISDALLDTLTNTQSALLNIMDTNEGPTIIIQPHISLYVNRLTPESLHSAFTSFSNSSYPSFSLPQLPLSLFPSGEPVGVRMLSLDKNPFSWNGRGNISGLIGALSLTTQDGSGIPVENLSEDIEILLPRPNGEQVNTSVLDLGNYSTTAIDIPSADSTLLLKMVPSVDPLPFKLFLGYKSYPTETNYVAMTEMPQKGTTLEERYTWILNPTNLKGNSGIHYLVVRPIVGPGIKSINATLSITPITSSCKFWNETRLDWSDYGCKVGVNSTQLLTQCFCNHLTFFGSSFFVTPNLVDPSRTAELFATFAENPVVVCFVGALFVTYLLVVVWARRKDIQDTVKVKGTVLEDNDPIDSYRYMLCVCTGHRIGAATSSQVIVTLLGEQGNSKPHHLTDPKKPLFERGAVDLFLLTTPYSLGELEGIRLWHNNSGSHPAWFVGNIVVQDLQTEQKWYFLCNSWLAIDMGDCCLDKLFPVSTETELKKFSNLFFMKTVKDFNDGHLWYSVINRPPSSTFTCVQRVSCCFSLLLCTMLTSIMFYGIPTDPSDQVMDLGHFQFTWQQFMIGVQSSLIMFPINILIVSIFRNTRPRETPCCQSKTKKTKSLEHENTLQTVSLQAATNSNGKTSLDNIIKDITRIVHSLSETAKRNIPFTESEFGSGKGTDINGVLSEVEDFLYQNYKTSDDIHSKSQVQLPGEGIQKKSNKIQHLYGQMCHLEKELTLLDPSCFSKPESVSRALQRVQSMKSFLEDYLSITSHANQTEHDKSRPADKSFGDNGQKKRVRQHGVLPWWFVFVGWLLVIAASFISGYFTMLYGLKFGKERSISWLVSMIVSFFQSLLFIQPLKVVGLAVFFALVIKKVDEEDFQDVTFEKVERRPGENSQTTNRWADCLYEPPPPADIEKMKRNKIMEQKAFALLTEILIYLGFMWMLLLVAYSQRDPNAFYLNQHIRDSFTGNIPDTVSIQDVFTWAGTSLFQNLFGKYPVAAQFASFYETATADLVLQYLIAFLVLLSTVKLWHLLRLNPKMNLITTALHRAWRDIANFLVIIVIMLVAFSIASNLIYGWKLYSYKTFKDSLMTIISLQIGIFNYDEVLDSEPVLGGLLFGSCIIFMSFMVLNLLISVILKALNEEKIHHKPSEEDEIVDLLLNKICNLFGVNNKSKKDSTGLDVSGSSGLALNNSRDLLIASSADVNIYHKSEK